MTTSVASYGGRELTRYTQAYWMLGLSLSVLIHLSLLGSCYLAGIHDHGTTARSFPSTIFLPRQSPAYIPGITPHALPRSYRGVPARANGTPVPVEDPNIDITLPTQGELAGSVEPIAGVGGEGESGGVTIPPEDESEPPAFRPVQIEPRVIRTVVPEYPSLARETGIEGKVWVKIWVDESGRPRKAVVIKGQAEVLNDAAIAAAMKFLFIPAVMNGQPVSVWVAIPFNFTLR